VIEEVGDAAELDLTRYIRPGALVAWSQGCAEPLTLTEALAGQRERLGGIRCFSGISTTAVVRPDCCDYLSFSSYTAAGANRALSEAGLLDIVPCHYSQLPDILGAGPLRADEAGVITGTRKSTDRGLTVTGLLLGTSTLVKKAGVDKSIRLRDTRYTHDQAVLAAQHALAAINSAIEVDLTGQANIEVARDRYVGGIGGAADFLRGAARSAGGIPVLALPSTAGTASRIVARLNGPAGLARADAGVIVTEYGVADLRGLSLARRRERMIAIAHPDHRAALDRTEDKT
jgi:acyl-CoA hydrolase